MTTRFRQFSSVQSLYAEALNMPDHVAMDSRLLNGGYAWFQLHDGTVEVWHIGDAGKYAYARDAYREVCSSRRPLPSYPVRLAQVMRHNRVSGSEHIKAIIWNENQS